MDWCHCPSMKSDSPSGPPAKQNLWLDSSIVTELSLFNQSDEYKWAQNSHWWIQVKCSVGTFLHAVFCFMSVNKCSQKYVCVFMWSHRSDLHMQIFSTYAHTWISQADSCNKVIKASFTTTATAIIWFMSSWCESLIWAHQLYCQFCSNYRALFIYLFTLAIFLCI